MNAYARAAGSAALQGLADGLFAAAAALPPARRRTARGVTVAGLSAVALIGRWAVDRTRPAPAEAEPEPASPEAEPASPAAVPPRLDRRQLAALGVGLAVTATSIFVRRRLERRWLTALRAQGHPHPYRVLGIRIGLLGFAGALPAQLARAHIHR